MVTLEPIWEGEASAECAATAEWKHPNACSGRTRKLYEASKTCEGGRAGNLQRSTTFRFDPVQVDVDAGTPSWVPAALNARSPWSTQQLQLVDGPVLHETAHVRRNSPKRFRL